MGDDIRRFYTNSNSDIPKEDYDRIFGSKKETKEVEMSVQNPTVEDDPKYKLLLKKFNYAFLFIKARCDCEEYAIRGISGDCPFCNAIKTLDVDTPKESNNN